MAGDSVGDDAELAAVRAALGITRVAKKAPAKKVAKKVAKKAVKKAQPSKSVAKKAPAAATRKAAVKRAPAVRKDRVRKAAAKKAAAADPTVPSEVAGEVVVPEPAEIIPALHELEDPARDAHDLWIQGMAWEEIALRTGYAGAQQASAAVAVWLQRGAIADGMMAARVRATQALEVTQRLKNAFWDQAMMGDKDAANIVLKANADFYRMAGLEAGALTVNSKRTIVISDNGGGAPGEGFAAQLRQAALDADEARRHANAEVQVTDTADDVR